MQEKNGNVQPFEILTEKRLILWGPMRPPSSCIFFSGRQAIASGNHDTVTISASGMCDVFGKTMCQDQRGVAGLRLRWLAS